MDEVMVIEDLIDAMWWRKLHVMANLEEPLAPYREQVPTWGTSIDVSKDAIQLHHLRAAWPAREPISLPVPLGVWPMVGWWVGDDRVSKAIKDGALVFALAWGVDAQYAFMKQIPAKAGEFAEVNGITLVRASWVPDGFVAVARGGMQPLSPRPFPITKPVMEKGSL